MSSYELPDGRKLPSVTTIIADCTDKSHGLTQWAANSTVEYIRQNSELYLTHPSPHDDDCYSVTRGTLDKASTHYKDLSKEALDIGSQVHHAIENYLIDGEYPFEGKSDQFKKAFDAFLEFEKEHKMYLYATELMVHDDRVAGTLDWCGVVDGKEYVLDWKTSKKLYKESHYQVAKYRELWGTNRAEGCGIVRIDKKTGLPEFKDTTKTYEKDLAVFEAMVDLFYLRHPRLRKEAGL